MYEAARRDYHDACCSSANVILPFLASLPAVIVTGVCLPPRLPSYNPFIFAAPVAIAVNSRGVVALRVAVSLPSSRLVGWRTPQRISRTMAFWGSMSKILVKYYLQERDSTATEEQWQVKAQGSYLLWVGRDKARVYSLGRVMRRGLTLELVARVALFAEPSY